MVRVMVVVMARVMVRVMVAVMAPVTVTRHTVHRLHPRQLHPQHHSSCVT